LRKSNMQIAYTLGVGERSPDGEHHG